MQFGTPLPAWQHNLCWPSQEVLAELQSTGLLQLWLEQRLNQALASQPQWCDQLEASFRRQIPSLFLQLRAKFERVVVRILCHSNPGLAREWFFRLQSHPSDATFNSLLPHSVHLVLPAPQQRLGYYGPLCLGDLDQALALPLRHCSIGKVLPPQQYSAEPLFVVTQLLERQPAQLTPELAAQLRDQLRNHWLQQTIDTLMQAPQQPGAPIQLTAGLSDANA